MKVFGLAGSPRAWSSVTLKLVEAVVRGAAAEGADIEVVEAAHLNIKRCRGCGECFGTGRCGQDDDLAFLLERMALADGIIVGSPAHAGGVAAPVETIMERMADTAHCRRFEGKYGVSVSVSRNGDERFALGHIDRFMDDCGVAVVGRLGASPGDRYDALAGAEALGRELAGAIREKRQYPEHEGSKALFLRNFRETIVAHRETWAHDYRFWLEKGWV
ncbi:MAG TPA: flavodoxin family protein [Methanocella sp.]|nr:flavodoxin family protein [Methanocella sp.]